jgi:hypothetical protein
MLKLQPANNIVNLEYIAINASSAYLMLVNLTTGDTDSLELDIQFFNTVCNLDVIINFNL